jgi:hypothetical protein
MKMLRGFSAVNQLRIPISSFVTLSFIEIGESFELPLSSEPTHKRIVFKRDENGTPISQTRRRSARNHELDTHREECEVCDRGGDLLCCDNCTLVYHLQCARPRMTEIPSGEWFCPYCADSKVNLHL